MYFPFTAENETKTKMDIHIRSKYENESHLIILVFLNTFSHQVSHTMRRQHRPGDPC